MELRQVVIVEMPDAIRRLPKAIPCCSVCFEVETHQKLFVVEDLVCECRLFLHDACVKDWFRIAGREVCPQCGQEWKVVEPCIKCERYAKICLLGWICFVITVLGVVGLYQIITNVYLH